MSVCIEGQGLSLTALPRLVAQDSGLYVEDRNLARGV